MTKARLLVTGGTGFLGKQLIPILEKNYEVDCLSRSAVGMLHGDLSQWNAGVEDLESLRSRGYSAMIHLAGLYDLGARQVDCYLNNVTGTSHALRLCRLLGIHIFLNTSSVAAGINSPLPLVRPSDLNFSTGFPDFYSESKALAEQLIMNWEEEPRVRVNIRPGVLVGSTVDGHISRIDGPYHAPQAMQRLRGFIEAFPSAFPLPGDDKKRIPIVPVDACAKAIAGLTDWALKVNEPGYHSFHLTPEKGMSISDFYRSSLKNLGIRNRGFVLVDRLPSMLVKKISKWAIRFPEEELSYLLGFPKYDTASTLRVLGTNWCPEFENYEQTFWSGYEAYISNR